MYLVEVHSDFWSEDFLFWGQTLPENDGEIVIYKPNTSCSRRVACTVCTALSCNPFTFCLPPVFWYLSLRLSWRHMTQEISLILLLVSPELNCSVVQDCPGRNSKQRKVGALTSHWVSLDAAVKRFMTIVQFLSFYFNLNQKQYCPAQGPISHPG